MITPKQAKQSIKPKKEVLKELEAKIDAVILENFKSGYRNISIDAKIFPNNATREFIMNNYKQNGWNVTYESSEDSDRGGNYIKFEAQNYEKKNYTKRKFTTTGQMND